MTSKDSQVARVAYREYRKRRKKNNTDCKTILILRREMYLF